MRVIISPAKKMNVDTDSLPCRGLPRFLDRTEVLLQRLRELNETELKALWKCNDKLVRLNADRVASMDLHRHLTPAILSYEGIQYRYMAPGVLSDGDLDYLQEHLRILSGFYGVLRPFDGVTPYRLEMQAKLEVCGAKNLYSYWDKLIADSIFQETDLVVDLASAEYGVCVSRYRPPDARILTCMFGEKVGDRVLEKGTLCKMARGEMVRFMAENRVSSPEELKSFDRLGYRFSPEDSGEDIYVFLLQPDIKERAWEA